MTPVSVSSFAGPLARVYCRSSVTASPRRDFIAKCGAFLHVGIDDDYLAGRVREPWKRNESKTGQLSERIAFRLLCKSGALYQSVLDHRGLHHGFQFVHQRSIPPTPFYLLAHESKGPFGCQRFAIRTVRGKRVINIHGLENSCRQRYRVAFQTVWIPTTVHFLVVVTDNGQNGSKRL